MIHIDDSNFATEIEQAEGLALLDFGATWCQPCKKLEPIMDDLSREYEGRVVIGHCDVAKGPGTAKRYGVMSVPTVLFLKRGEPIDRFVGLQSREKIVEMIQKHL
jgi:thioredoxin 1